MKLLNDGHLWSNQFITNPYMKSLLRTLHVKGMVRIKEVIKVWQVKIVPHNRSGVTSANTSSDITVVHSSLQGLVVTTLYCTASHTYHDPDV